MSEIKNQVEAAHDCTIKRAIKLAVISNAGTLAVLGLGDIGASGSAKPVMEEESCFIQAIGRY